MTDNFHFYKDIVYQTLPRANCVWTPAVSGAKRNVVLASAPNDGAYVFKFTDKNYAIRNENIASALRDAGIPAPEIIAHEYNEQWFEMYPEIHGQTLYECVGNGVSHTELTKVYVKLLKLFEKMSQIDFANIDFCDLKYAHQTARLDTTKTNNAFMGNIVGSAVRIMNIGPHSSKGLYHHGMTPKNVMISNRGEIAGVLDIDEAGVCNINYALGVMLAKAKLIGMDVNALCREYELISGQRINHSQISAIIGIQNFGRNILYKTKSK